MRSRSVSDFFGAINTYLRDVLDIYGDHDLLKQCFSLNYAREYDENSIASYACNVPVVGFKEENERFRSLVIEKENAFTDHANLNPIFFYAYVGQGKTTYLKHLIDIRFIEEAVFEELKNKIYFLYVAYTDTDPECTYISIDAREGLILLVNRVLSEHNIEENYDFLSAVFPSEKFIYESLNINHNAIFVNFKKHILERLGENGYFRGIIKWLWNTRRIKICSVVDNIDQHFHFDKSEGRDNLIKVLQELRAMRTQLIIPMRHSNKGFQNHQFFKTFLPIPVTLGLPDYGEMIIKRIAYIEKFYLEKLIGPIIVVSEGVYYTTQDMFDSLKQICFWIDKDEDVKLLLYLITNYISRSYLRLMVNVFSSRPMFCHPLSGEKIDYENAMTKGRFSSLFTYALMLRKKQYHNEDDADIYIINLFNNRDSNNWNAFIRYHVLYRLSQYSDMVDIGEFINGFKRIYTRIDSKAIKKAIKLMILKECVSYITDDQMEDHDIASLLKEESISISISPRGVYHLDLVNKVEYYEVLAMPDMLYDGHVNDFHGKEKRAYRARNLERYIKRLVLEETALREIISSEYKFDDYLFWTNNVLPGLIKEYNEIFLSINISISYETLIAQK
jgi:hypothetical protein